MARPTERKPVPSHMKVAGRCNGEAEPFASCVTWGKSLCLSGQHGPREPSREQVPREHAGQCWRGSRSQADLYLCPQSQDAGTYTCTAENAVGRARRRVHLTILALPVFTTLPGDRSLRLGDKLWLHCAARGSPTPQIGWTVNNRLVTGLGLLGAGGTGTRDPGRLKRMGKRVPVSLWVLGLQTWPCMGGTGQTHVALRDQSQVRSDKKPPAKKTQPWRPPGQEQGPSSSPTPQQTPFLGGSFPPPAPQALFWEAQGLDSITDSMDTNLANLGR